MLRDACTQVVSALQRGDVEANAVYTFVQSAQVVFLISDAVCTTSAFSLATRYLREHVFVAIADHSSRASNVDVSRPERCSLWWVSFSAHASGVCFF